MISCLIIRIVFLKILLWIIEKILYLWGKVLVYFDWELKIKINVIVVVNMGKGLWKFRV